MMPAIAVLDVETTGKDRARDQVIELCVQLGVDDLSEFRTWRFKPSIPIHPEATKVHGITDADLAACPTFADSASQVVAHIAAAEVIVGYNVAFDLDMLQAELQRAGLPALDLAAKHVVDVLRLWHHVEPRTLVAAHQKFCGAELDGAHQAAADVAATARVLRGMLSSFGLTEKPWPDLAAMANPFEGRAKWIGPSHHIQWGSDGKPVIAFGKYSGTPIARVDSGFLSWVGRNDFPPHVKEICRAALTFGGDVEGYIAQRYPRPPTTEADHV